MTAFDLRSGILPFVFLDIRRHFKEMRPGASISVICEPAALEDLFRILPENSFDAAQKAEPGDDQGILRVVVRKKGNRT